MPQPKVFLDYKRCDPGACLGEVCAVAQVCERKVQKQASPGELPEIKSALCLGCTDCLSACPRNALKIIK